MIVTCPKCNTGFNLKDNLVKKTGTNVRCTDCTHIFKVFPKSSTKEPVNIAKKTADNKVEKADTGQGSIKQKSDQKNKVKDGKQDRKQDEKKAAKKGTEFDEFDMDMDGEDDLDLNLDLDLQDDVKVSEPKKEVEEDLDFSDIEQMLETEEKKEPETGKSSDDGLDLDLDLDFDIEEDSELSGSKKAEDDDLDFSDIEQMLEIEEESDSKDKADNGDLELEFELDLDEDLNSDDEKLDLDSDDDEIDKIGKVKNKGKKEENLSLDLNKTLDLEEEPDSKVKEEDLELSLDFEDEDAKESPAVTPKVENEQDFELSIDEHLEMEGASEDKAESDDLELKLDMEEEGETKKVDHQDAEMEVEEDLSLDLDDTSLEMDKEKPKKSSIEETISLDFAEHGEEEEIAASEDLTDFELSEEDGIPGDKASDMRKGEPFIETVVMDSRTDKSDLKSASDMDDADAEESSSAEKRRFSMPVLALLIVLVLGGIGFFAYTLFDGKAKPKETQDVTGNLNINTFDISNKFIENPKTGRLFVITGKARNDYDHARGFIRIASKLYSKGKTLSQTEKPFCGNIISDSDLAALDLDSIKKKLMNRVGDNNLNKKIDSGKEIPFMVVFANLPESLEEFTIEVAGSEPVN